jgi:hypothetical protein
MKYVLNFFYNGEEYYLPIEEKNILDSVDNTGEKHKVIDECDYFISLEADRSVDMINKTMQWFIENGLDMSLAEDFMENVLDIDIEINEVDDE